MGNPTLKYRCVQREDIKFMKRTLCDIKRNKSKVELEAGGYHADKGFCPGCDGPTNNVTQKESTKPLPVFNKPRVFDRNLSIKLYGFEIKKIEKIGLFYRIEYIANNGETIKQSLNIKTQKQVSDYLEGLKQNNNGKQEINNPKAVSKEPETITVSKMKEKMDEFTQQRKEIDSKIKALDDCIRMFS